MIRMFADGTIEIRGSSRACPPGFTGQAGNRSSVWFRVNGGEWEYSGQQSMHRTYEILDCADSVAEFREMVEVFA